MSWQDQGRQYHMWFGHGTSGLKEKPSKAGPDPMFDPGSLDKRIDAVAHGSLMHLPRKEWHRPVLSFDRERLERLRTAMTTWLGARALSNAAFGAKLLDPLTSDAAVGALRAAAKGAQTAQSHEDLKDASGELAAGMQGVGLDKWPGFLRDAADRAEAYKPDAGRIMLAQASSRTRTDASATGVATARSANSATITNAVAPAQQASGPAAAQPSTTQAPTPPPVQPQTVTAYSYARSCRMPGTRQTAMSTH